MLSGIEDLSRRNKAFVAGGERLSRKGYPSRGRLVGGLGERHAVVSLATTRRFALEVFGPTAVASRRVEEYVRALTRCNHEHVLFLHAAWEEEGVILLLTDLPDSSLSERIRRTPPLSEGEAGTALADVCRALVYFHGLTPPIMHRALTPNHILSFGARWRVTCCAEDPFAAECPAPETLRGAAPNEKTDVWALGALMFEALQGRAPFRLPRERRGFDKAEEERLLGGRLEFDRALSVEAMDAIARMLSAEPSRPTAREVLDLAFFRRLRGVPYQLVASQRVIASGRDENQTAGELAARAELAERRHAELVCELRAVDAALARDGAEQLAEARRQLAALEAQAREFEAAELQRKTEQNKSLYAFARELGDAIVALSGRATTANGAAVDISFLKAALSSLFGENARGAPISK